MTALGVILAGSLHQRIGALQTQYSEHQAALTAMRLLGNAGSHTLDRVTATYTCPVCLALQGKIFQLADAEFPGEFCFPLLDSGIRPGIPALNIIHAS